MDLVTLHVISGIMSGAFEMVATVIVLFCVMRFFSFKPGGSTKFFSLSLAYFFSSFLFLLVNALVLKEITGSLYLRLGVSALLMAALIHLVHGVLIIALYIRTVKYG